MKKTLIPFFALLLSSALANAGLVMTNYVNNEDFPVKISIPYYPEDGGKMRPLEITLEKGDLYVPRRRSTGYVFKKYALFPDMVKAWPKGKADINEGVAKKLNTKAMFASGQTNRFATMPKWWINGSSNTFAEKYLDTYRNLSSREKLTAKQKSTLEFYSPVTNVVQAAYSHLSNPDDDPDGDGQDNYAEFLAETSPLFYDRLYFDPAVVVVMPENGDVVTSRFSVVNSSATNHHCYVEYVSTDNTDRFGRIVDGRTGKTGKGRWGTIQFDLNPGERRELLFICQRNRLPFNFYDKYMLKLRSYEGTAPDPDLIVRGYHGSLDDSDDGCNPDDKVWTHGKAWILMADTKSLLLPTRPEPTGPKNGALFAAGDEVRFSWHNGKSVPNDGSELETVVELYFWSDEFKQLYSGDQIKGTGNMLPNNQSSCKHVIKPDEHPSKTYFWRIRKRTSSNRYVYSDWSWFCKGEKVEPKDIPKLRLKNKVVYHRMTESFATGYHPERDYINREKKSRSLGNLDKQFTMFFTEPLPKWITLDKEKPEMDFFPFSYSFRPPYGSAGTFTNYLVVSNGEVTLTNMHIFIVEKY